MVDYNTTNSLTLQSDFQQVPDGASLTCILPPDGGDYWPFGGNPASNNTTSGGGGGNSTPNTSGSSEGKNGLSAGAKAGIALGVILGVALIAAATYFIRKAALKKQQHVADPRRVELRDEDTWEGKGTTYPSS